MSTDQHDLFGKIDALLGKRAPDALLEKELDIEDFPILTEVIDSIPDALSGGDRRLRERRTRDRRVGDRRQGGTGRPEAASGAPGPAAVADRSVELEQLARAIEQRLTELFIRQQMRTEEAVRRLIRDELDRFYRPDGQEAPD